MRRLSPVLLGWWLLLGGCPSEAAETTTSFKACGGDPTGAWSVESITLIGVGNVYLGSLAETPECANIVSAIRVTPNGTYTFAGTTLSTDVGATIDLDLLLTSSCLTAVAESTRPIEASSTFCLALGRSLMTDGEISKASCDAKADACACTASVDEMSTQSEGTYVVKGDHLVIDGGAERVSFCVDGDTLHIESMQMGVMGTALLELKRK